MASRPITPLVFLEDAKQQTSMNHPARGGSKTFEEWKAQRQPKVVAEPTEEQKSFRRQMRGEEEITKPALTEEQVAHEVADYPQDDLPEV